jgi:hypothetical protein
MASDSFLKLVFNWKYFSRLFSDSNENPSSQCNLGSQMESLLLQETKNEEPDR